MPVTLPTTYGKTDYAVTQALERLRDFANHLEAEMHQDTPSDTGRLRAELQQVAARVDALAKQVQTLQQAP